MAEAQNQTEVDRSDRSAQAQIWNLIYGFADSLILRCAVELRLADIIAANEKPISLSKLASQLPFPSVNKDHLYRILRYLVHMKLFSSVSGDAPDEPHYGLAPAGKYLVSGWDQCMNPTILIISDRDIMAPFHHMKESLAPDGPTTFERVLGMDIWDFMAANPEKNKIFNEGMAGDTRLLTATLIRECGDVFEGIGSLVDVGGGTGTALLAIARAFPHIKCKVFDLPHVIADSPEYPEVEKVEGDMFKGIPAADAILMKCILHDWDDEKSVEILKKCKEAVCEVGGKVIIVDIVLDVKSDHPYTRMRISMDLDMMLTTGGKERSEDAWRKLISDAGFKSFNIRHISATQSLIEAFP